MQKLICMVLSLTLAESADQCEQLQAVSEEGERGAAFLLHCRVFQKCMTTAQCVISIPDDLMTDLIFEL